MKYYPSCPELSDIAKKKKRRVKIKGEWEGQTHIKKVILNDPFKQTIRDRLYLEEKRISNDFLIFFNTFRI